MSDPKDVPNNALMVNRAHPHNIRIIKHISRLTTMAYTFYGACIGDPLTPIANRRPAASLAIQRNLSGSVRKSQINCRGSAAREIAAPRLDLHSRRGVSAKFLSASSVKSVVDIFPHGRNRTTEDNSDKTDREQAGRPAGDRPPGSEPLAHQQAPPRQRAAACSSCSSADACRHAAPCSKQRTAEANWDFCSFRRALAVIDLRHPHGPAALFRPLPAALGSVYRIRAP